MTSSEYAAHPEFKPVYAGTHVQVRDWLVNTAVGNTGFAASYLDELRATVDHALAAPQNETRDVILSAVMNLGVTLNQTTEGRLWTEAQQNDNRLNEGFPGIEPLHTVTEEDLGNAAYPFDSYNPNAPGYANADVVTTLHRAFVTNALFNTLSSRNQ